jgi:hypothetical protein
VIVAWSLIVLAEKSVRYQPAGGLARVIQKLHRRSVTDRSVGAESSAPEPPAATPTLKLPSKPEPAEFSIWRTMTAVPLISLVMMRPGR